MTQYVTKADLSFPVGPVNPDTGEKRRVRRFQGISLEHWAVPWPMTPGGARLFVLLHALGSVFLLTVALWAGFAFFEPSLMCLVPGMLALLVVRFAINPALDAYGRRSGMDRREVEGE